MDELYLPFAVMIVTVAVLAGLMLIFRNWMAARERLLRDQQRGVPDTQELRRAA
jgi:hypothetical protein